MSSCLEHVVRLPPGVRKESGCLSPPEEHYYLCASCEQRHAESLFSQMHESEDTSVRDVVDEDEAVAGTNDDTDSNIAFSEYSIATTSTVAPLQD